MLHAFQSEEKHNCVTMKSLQRTSIWPQFLLNKIANLKKKMQHRRNFLNRGNVLETYQFSRKAFPFTK